MPFILALPYQTLIVLSSSSEDDDDMDDTFVKIIKIHVGKKTYQASLTELCSKSQYFSKELEKDSKRTEFRFDDEEARIINRILYWVWRGDIKLPSDDPNGIGKLLDLSQATQPELDEEYEYRDANGKVTRGPVVRYPDPERNEHHGLEEDNESQASTLYDASQTQALTTKSLDTLELAKVYAVAERLGMPVLCNMVIDRLGGRLGQCSSSGMNMATPIEALIYAYGRPKTEKEYLRKLLVDFTSLAAPVHDLFEMFPPEKLPAQLMYDLLKQLPIVRGEGCLDSEAWAKHFQQEKRYYHFRRSPQSSVIPRR